MGETAQYLTFTLEDEVFAVDIDQVREVLEVSTLTKMPQTPDFMCGVINLRGKVVPVVDMRIKFGMDKGDRTVNTCIIILEVREEVVIGTLVDSVKEVVELAPETIEPPPQIGTGVETKFLKGMGKQGDRFIIILDINQVFSQEDLVDMQ